jgi:hypothetical protein
MTIACCSKPPLQPLYLILEVGYYFSVGARRSTTRTGNVYAFCKKPLRGFRSVGCRPLDVIDDEDIDWPLDRFHLRAELFLQRGEYRRTNIRRCCGETPFENASGGATGVKARSRSKLLLKPVRSSTVRPSRGDKLRANCLVFSPLPWSFSICISDKTYDGEGLRLSICALHSSQCAEALVFPFAMCEGLTITGHHVIAKDRRDRGLRQGREPSGAGSKRSEERRRALTDPRRAAQSTA